MASLRSYGSQSSLPPAPTQEASSAPRSGIRISKADTFGTDNDTESQRVIRDRMTSKEDIRLLREESIGRLNRLDTEAESIRLTQDQHGQRLTSVQETLDQHTAKFTSIEKTLGDHTTKFTSIEKTSRLQYDTIQKQILGLETRMSGFQEQMSGFQEQMAGLSAALMAISVHLNLPTSMYHLPSPQVTDDAAHAATQLIPQISRSSPPLEPIQFSRHHIRAPSDPPTPGPSTRRLPNTEWVDFPVNPSEVDVHQLLSEARADTNPDTKHAVKGLIQNLKTIVRSMSSKNLKSSKSVKSFKTTN